MAGMGFYLEGVGMGGVLHGRGAFVCNGRGVGMDVENCLGAIIMKRLMAFEPKVF